MIGSKREIASGPDTRWAHQSGDDRFGTWASVTVSGVAQKFRWIEPGTFWMGSPDDDEEAYTDEKPRHQVRLTEGYWLAETEVTQMLWSAVMGDNPKELTVVLQQLFLAVMGNNLSLTRQEWDALPVEMVAWDDVPAFLTALNKRVPGLEARLPTEAQWEYAARAGTETSRYGPLDEVAWHRGNSDRTTHPVGTKAPNAWGLYDMLGNVWEWCLDYYDGGEYGARAIPIPGLAIEDPMGQRASLIGLICSPKGGSRVVRGGCCSSGVRFVRAAVRCDCDPADGDCDRGFRLSRGP